ncbi:MAG TPA: branched-chain amino acid ABC transporter permease [Candidatus Elarobacter sp.]|jgi:branched-chain amino acid transport system permease protein|nr:branched-chain amino acid ABC transporter permease [Candidatus Elarobacter sp.]
MIRFAALVLIVALAPVVVHYPELETQILTFGLLAISFSLLLGEMGFLSFGQATFNGVGAYAAARLLIDAHAALPLALLVALAAGALAAAAVGALAITGRGVYGVMLTFAFNEMAYYVAFQWRGVTGGDNGLRGIPRPDVFGISLDDPTRYYAFVAVVVLLAFAAVLRLNASPFGAVLRAIRENEDRARSIGFRTKRFKVGAFAISGALAGLAGGLYAELYRFVPLQAIDLDTSTNVVIAALLGGAGSPFGALLGAAIFTVLSDSLSHVWSHWPLIFGVVFCAVVLFFRGGLWSLVDRRSGRAAHA